MRGNEAESQPLEGIRLRIVRCPKCGSLLPEFPQFSIYQCGGCNTTLQAKYSAPLLLSSSKKSTSERMLNSEATRITCRDDGNQSKNADLAEGGAMPSLDGNANFVSVSGDFRKEPTSLSEEGAYLCSTGGDDQIIKVEACSNAIVPAGIYGDLNDDSDSKDNPSCQKIDKKENRGVESPNTYANDQHHRSYVIPSDGRSYPRNRKADTVASERRNSNSDEVVESQRWPQGTQRAEGRGIHTIPHLDEHPYQPSFRYDNRRNGKEGFSDSVEHADQFESEILRKIDELKDQLIKFRIIKDDKNSSQVGGDRSNHAYQISNANGQRLDRRYSSNSQIQQLPSADEFEINMSSRRVVPTQELVRYGNMKGTSPTYGSPYQPYSSMYRQKTSSTYRNNHFEAVPSMSHAHDRFQHSFSCTSGHNNHLHTPPQHSRMVFSNERSPFRGDTHSFYPIDSDKFQNTTYKGNRIGSSWNSHGSLNHDNFTWNSPSQQKCQSIAGGAPYITCNACFELLMLPHGIVTKRNPAKLLCGKCLQVIVFVINQNRLRIVDTTATNQLTDCLKDQAPLDIVPFLDPSNSTPTRKNDEIMIRNIGTSECVSVARNERSEQGRSPKLGKTVNHEAMLALQSTSGIDRPKLELYHQDYVDEPEDIPQQKPIVNSGVHDSPPAGDSSPDSGHLDCQPNQGVIKYVFGNMAGLSNRGIVVPMNNNHRPMSEKNQDLATEPKLLPKEYPKDYSPGSPVGKKEDERYGRPKGGIQYIAKHKNEESKPSPSSPNARFRVSINGHRISNQAVASAAKKAGAIQSGDYWYDSTAGFWGIMGQPCLGIIPPGIEEFDFPMSSNCAGGNTNIKVNGRELHQKDLDLLTGRGLPSSRGRSYIIEISGRVRDAVSGEELAGLGRLAPTVERYGQGFGMRPPRDWN